MLHFKNNVVKLNKNSKLGTKDTSTLQKYRMTESTRMENKYQNQNKTKQNQSNKN